VGLHADPRPIGVFDSGVGGLTVLREILRRSPSESTIYLGDNARAPYGSRSQEEIHKYTRQAVDWLSKNGCELVILACNTASSQALRKIQQETPDIKVLGVLILVAEAVAKLDGKIGILATKATVESGAYVREIQKLNAVEHPMFNILQVATPLLVPLIEAGKIDGPEIKEAIREYLKEFERGGIKNIILGCTHYPLIKDLIQAELPDAKIFESPSVIPASLKNYLSRHPEIEKHLSKNDVRRYITTGDPEKFSKFAKEFLNMEIVAEKIVL